MDEWDLVRQKIRDLESAFLNPPRDSGPGGQQGAPLSDFWKRRYDEERQAWEAKLAAKEREQREFQERFSQDEKAIHLLTSKIRDIEQRLELQRAVHEQKSKATVLETELEKNRLDWEARIRTLEEENRTLRLKAGRAEQLESSVAHDRALQQEKEKLEKHVRNLEIQLNALRAEDQQKLTAIEAEKSDLQRQVEELRFKRDDVKKRQDESERELTLLLEQKHRQLSQIQEREKEHFEAFESLARGFTHKLKNIVSVMQGSIKICLEERNPDDAVKQEVVALNENLHEAYRSLVEFQMLSRTPETSFQPVDLNACIEKSIARIDLAKRSALAWTKSLAKDLPQIPGDSEILIEGLTQIIQNAVEASPPGGTVTVASEYDAANKKAVIRVSDQGAGIPADVLGQIFVPYFTTRKKKRGLGLCIAKRSVDLHGGSLAIASAEKQGTTVSVTLPIPA